MKFTAIVAGLLFLSINPSGSLGQVQHISKNRILMAFLLAFIAVAAFPNTTQAQQVKQDNDVIFQSFQKAGFNLERIEFEFDFRPASFQPKSHRLFSHLSFHCGETQIPLKGKIFGQWEKPQTSKAPRSIQIEIPLRLWQLGYHKNFFAWSKRMKDQGAIDSDKGLKKKYWKRCKFKSVVENQVATIQISLPKKVDPKKGFCFPAQTITLNSTGKDRRQDSIFAYEIHPQKNVKTATKGWMITYRSPQYVKRAKALRDITSTLYRCNLLDQSTAIFLYDSIQSMRELDRQHSRRKLSRKVIGVKKRKMESKETSKRDLDRNKRLNPTSMPRVFRTGVGTGAS